jgi:hypothetical protein
MIRRLRQLIVRAADEAYMFVAIVGGAVCDDTPYEKEETKDKKQNPIKVKIHVYFQKAKRIAAQIRNLGSDIRFARFR